MKKIRRFFLIALLSALMVPEIVQADECVFLTSQDGHDYYYHTMSLRYSGDSVKFLLLADNCLLEIIGEVEIDCAKKTIRYQDPVNPNTFTGWAPVHPDTFDDALRKKLCP
ncbi:MAG: hypothetical protein EHM45_00815 [Desulfobacteraceae bacterium]|nr:MAG: hypothetical protein EHM45_00815 [Desulfobacteraceae bacterium]